MVYENNIKNHKSFGLRVAFILIATIIVTALITLSGFGSRATHAASVKQVSTGAASACAVVDGNVKCWGANDFGQLGNGNTTSATTPVAVSKQAGALAGKYVEKVSVGLTHACALADAQVYCWGDNSRGQLGNHSATNSPVPVAVATNGTAKSNTETVCTSYVFSWCVASKQVTTTKPVSSLANKEIVDISAGEFFTCALASDGTVSCWGNGENGRLGTNAKTDTNYPQAIYSASGSAFAGKKGVKLAKAAGATMCVIAVESATTTATGSSYCWGYGIDDGTKLPANGTSTVACGKNTPTTKPATSSLTFTTIFESAKPVNVPGATFAAIDGSDYVTGQSTDGRAYYWGMYGYIETASVSNLTTCTVNPCTSRVNETISLALTSTQKKARDANQGGGDKNKNLNSNKNAQAAANNAANGGVRSSLGYSGGNTGSGTVQLSGPAGYSTTGSTAVIGRSDDGLRAIGVTTHYQGTATPTGYYSGPSTSNVGNNKNGNSCANQTHYGYTKASTYDWSGKKVATTPPAWSGTQGGFTAMSGDVNNGLFCASNGAATNCDTHGTSAEEGQTGSNYTKQCVTTGWIFTTTTCDPAPTGPQQVVSNGWLAGKSVSSLSTGTSGYTCALASGAVGCWGVNNYGQLGNGSTTSKKVPTAVNL